MKVIVSKFMPPPGPEWKIHFDWRERLNRNLNHRSTAKWEPLDAGKNPAQILMMGNNILMHPKTFAIINFERKI